LQALAWCEAHLLGAGHSLEIYRYTDQMLRGTEESGSSSHKKALLRFYTMEIDSVESLFPYMAGMFAVLLSPERPIRITAL
jgi:hypothetical protein